jgi:hypothetical protein
MFSGRKRGAPVDGIATPRRGLGIVLLAVVLGFWGWQLSHPADGLGAVAAAEAHGEDDDD